MKPVHEELAAGRWLTFTLAEQLGNVGSEVSRALRARAQGNQQRCNSAVDRALELLDLTIADPKHLHRPALGELCRLREAICDYFVGDNEFGSSPELWESYFLPFAVLARRDR